MFFKNSMFYLAKKTTEGGFTMKKKFTSLCTLMLVASLVLSSTSMASTNALTQAQADSQLTLTTLPLEDDQSNLPTADLSTSEMADTTTLNEQAATLDTASPEETLTVEDTSVETETDDVAIPSDEEEQVEVIEPTIENYFTDVTKNAFYYDALQHAIQQNYIAYDEQRLFNGNQTVTRMDVVHMLIQVKGLTVDQNQALPSYKDVQATDPNMPYIATVVNAGLMRGDNLNQFNPTKPLTRAELATVLKNAFSLQAATANNFHDVYKNSWYEEAVRALLTNGVSNGYGNYLFKPESSLTRAEMIVFFVRSGEPSFRLAPLSIPEASCARPTKNTTYRVDVSVMNIWKYYNIARAVDTPSMTDPVNYDKWIASMNLSQKKWLVDRTDTQALYNDEVKILEERGNMYRVAAVDQWVPYNSSGYPGWVPKSQVAAMNVDTSECRVAIITADKAPILNMDTSYFMPVSYSTILPVVRIVGNWVVVQTPQGEKVIDHKHLKVYDSYEEVTKPTRADIVNEAKRFMNLPYLWAGTSSWGYDCSGIIYAVYRNFGIMIPRDSFYQAIKGKAVAKKDLQPGDLIFFAYNGGKGKVYHVGIYVSPGKMLHAPHYASQVKIESFETGVYAKNYAGARSYLD